MIAGQTNWYIVACTRKQDFTPAVAVELCISYVDTGYKILQIDRYFERFIRNDLNRKTNLERSKSIIVE